MNYLFMILTAIAVTAIVIAYFKLFQNGLSKSKRYVSEYIFECSIFVFNIYMSYRLINSFGLSLYYFSLMFLINIVMCISIIDYRTRYIPNILLLIMFALGALTIFIIPGVSFINSIITATALFLILVLVNRLSKNEIGMGDVRIISIIALFLGYYRVSAVIFISLLISFVYGIVIVIKNKQNLKTEIPFAPFIFIGLVINLLS